MLRADDFYRAIYKTLFGLNERHHARRAGKPVNDNRCAGCGGSRCHCPDPIWTGATPPSAA